MGPSTSMLLRILSLSLGRTFSPGDEVIVTNCDHEANIGPWVDLPGVTVRTWRLNPETLELHLDDLRALLTERTRLVAVTHTSNVLGTINPIKDIARVVHDAGAMICVDGVAYAPHRAIDVQDLDVDFYALSFYKVYGPHYALLYGKRERLLEIPGINHFFIDQSDIPYKFQPGNVNYELSYGMLGLWDYLGGFAAAHGRGELEDRSRAQVEFAYEAFATHEEKLAQRLLGFLETRSNVRVMGRTDADRRQRVPTISFVVDGVPSDSITAAVDDYEIGIRYGDFYARRLIDDLGLGPRNGVVRVSMITS
jgi:selenocysteine lyase/cysteine desulfurase